MSYPELKMLIGGDWTDGSSGNTEPVFCPADGRIIGTLPHASPADLDMALQSSLEGFNIWRKKTPHERQSVLEKAARQLESSFENISANLTREMGKPIAEARIELRVAIDLLRWYGEEGKRVYGRIIPSRFQICSMRLANSRWDPWWHSLLGFSCSKCYAQSCGALAAGCSITIKPSEETPATAIAIGRALTDAGLPQVCLTFFWSSTTSLRTSSVINYTSQVELHRQCASWHSSPAVGSEEHDPLYHGAWWSLPSDDLRRL